MKRYPCRCCGYFTISKLDNYDICPVCLWEDDGTQARFPDQGGGANKESLNESRAYFQKHGVSAERRINRELRLPLPEELPENNPEFHEDLPAHGAFHKTIVTDYSCSNLRELLEELFYHPVGFVTSGEYFSVVDFLSGLDVCTRVLDLRQGFLDWLRKRSDAPQAELGWPWVALLVMAAPSSQTTASEEELIEGLGRLLFEYLDEKDGVSCAMGDDQL